MGPAFHRLLQMPIFRDGLMDYSLGNSAQQKALRLKVKPKWKLKNRAVPRIRAIKDASGFKCICLSYGPRRRLSMEKPTVLEGDRRGFLYVPAEKAALIPSLEGGGQ